MHVYLSHLVKDNRYKLIFTNVTRIFFSREVWSKIIEEIMINDNLMQLDYPGWMLIQATTSPLTYRHCIRSVLNTLGTKNFIYIKKLAVYPDTT